MRDRPNRSFLFSPERPVFVQQVCNGEAYDIVDDGDDTITLNVTDGLCIRWIADGKTIAYGDSIDLDNYSDEIGSYVRAEVFGVGGIAYTQAMLLEYEDAPEAETKDFTDFWWILSFIPDTLVRLLGSLEFFQILWDALN